MVIIFDRKTLGKHRCLLEVVARKAVEGIQSKEELKDAVDNINISTNGEWGGLQKIAMMTITPQSLLSLLLFPLPS